MSGFPGRFDACSLYLNPFADSALRKSLSGVVSSEWTFRIMAEMSLPFFFLADDSCEAITVEVLSGTCADS